jgi:hypothetical protein
VKGEGGTCRLAFWSLVSPLLSSVSKKPLMLSALRSKLRLIAWSLFKRNALSAANRTASQDTLRISQHSCLSPRQEQQPLSAMGERGRSTESRERKGPTRDVEEPRGCLQRGAEVSVAALRRLWLRCGCRTRERGKRDLERDHGPLTVAEQPSLVEGGIVSPREREPRIDCRCEGRGRQGAD